MKKLLILPLILGLSACVGNYADDTCPDEYPYRLENGNCAKGMRMGDGVIESALILGAGVAMVP